MDEGKGAPLKGSQYLTAILQNMSISRTDPFIYLTAILQNMSISRTDPFKEETLAWVFGGAFGTFPPLTLTLSPLRGEGTRTRAT
jgi:hypothetical protein